MKPRTVNKITAAKIIEIGKDYECADGHVTLDFVNSLATSHFLLDRVLSEPFEVSDKTYVLANAFKSIEEIVPCCLMLIDKTSNSSLPVQVSCFVGRDKKDFHISDFSKWMNKATLGNLSHAVRNICYETRTSNDIYYAIQQWTDIQRNGFFHKHGLVYQSFEEMISENPENGKPTLEGILHNTMELALKIVLWTHEVCDILNQKAQGGKTSSDNTNLAE